MAFEIFEKKGGKYTQPRISITRAGQIGMNRACVQKHFKNTNFVCLYYDKTNKVMGIKPTDKETNNTFKLTTSSGRTSGSISGKSFLNYYEINFSEKKRFVPTWDDDEKMLLINIE